GVAPRLELRHELDRRRSHRGQHEVEGAAEEIDAAVGQARGEQRDELTIAAIGVAEGKPEGVAFDPAAVVELAVEPLERLSQRGGSSHSALARMISSPAIMQKTRSVGVVGLGAIGRQVCRALDDGLPGLRLAAGLARDPERAGRFLAGLRSSPPLLPLPDLIAASDIVVEASTQAHLAEIAPRALAAGRDLVVLSCGGLLGRQDWVDLAQANGCRILVPSGA